MITQRQIEVTGIADKTATEDFGRTINEEEIVHNKNAK